MYRGSSIELNALGESWRCRKCQKIGYCPFAGLGRYRDFLCRDRAFYFGVAIGFGLGRVFLGHDRVCSLS